ncbi:MAG: MFS transporter [Candidatus Eisenbacteria bacterium]|nr:MFS transporter [Candidatus Eisenbacteria bacterium]
MNLRTKLFWVALLYFAQGFPFGIVYDLLPVYFRTHEVALRDIGFLSFIGMPWTFKVFWSPLVDRFGTRQRWIIACLLGMGTLLACLPFANPAVSHLADDGATVLRPATVVWGLLLVFTTLSATQDIAIDAYTIGLMDKGEEGAANSLRVSAYRVAMIAAGGGLVALATWFSWNVIFFAGAGIFVLLALVVPRTPSVAVPEEAKRELFGPLWLWVKRSGGWAVLVFILIYKVGDAAMAPMLKPFWIDRGLSPAEIGLVSTTVGIIASVVGAMVGGAWITRIGIFHGLWVLGLFQALSNLGYAGAALWDIPREGIYAASIVESFCGGLGTAAFLSFLMNVCDKEHAAVQYALLSALFGFSRSISGGFSGWGTEHLGYAAYFGTTFLLALPAYLLLPWVRRWIRERQ